MANPALSKKLTPSKELANVIGATPVSRGEAVAKIWEYFKSNNLNSGRNIKADSKLRPIFEKDQITMFEVGKILSKHLAA